MIVPVLRTPGATSAANPPSRAVMMPSFTTEAPAWPASIVSAPPRMKLATAGSPIRPALATTPATSTRAEGPNQMPLGLAMTTRPFEVIVPKIFDGSVPMTRLTAIDAASGWLKDRRWSAVTEKLFQSITVRCVAVVTVMSCPAVCIVAVPATTCPLVGRS